MGYGGLRWAAAQTCLRGIPPQTPFSASRLWGDILLLGRNIPLIINFLSEYCIFFMVFFAPFSFSSVILYDILYDCLKVSAGRTAAPSHCPQGGSIMPDTPMPGSLAAETARRRKKGPATHVRPVDSGQQQAPHRGGGHHPGGEALQHAAQNGGGRSLQAEYARRAQRRAPEGEQYPLKDR